MGRSVTLWTSKIDPKNFKDEVDQLLEEDPEMGKKEIIQCLKRYNEEYFNSLCFNIRKVEVPRQCEVVAIDDSEVMGYKTFDNLEDALIDSVRQVYPEVRWYLEKDSDEVVQLRCEFGPRGANGCWTYYFMNISGVEDGDLDDLENTGMTFEIESQLIPIGDYVAEKLRINI